LLVEFEFPTNTGHSQQKRLQPKIDDNAEQLTDNLAVVEKRKCIIEQKCTIISVKFC